VAVKFRDYYEVLGVARNASADDIKRAYRQLARKQHPDLQPKAERAQAAERFKEINEAYEVLRDADKRAKYDALGAQWKSGQDFTPPQGGEWGGSSTQWEDLGDFSDFFASIFGQAPGAGGRRGRRTGNVAFPGSNLEAELTVSLEHVLRGGRHRITLPDGRNLDVTIPVGVREDAVLRLAGQGEPGMNGGPAGDLFLRIRIAPHPRYRIRGDDLEIDVPLWPWQAVLGASVRIETPDGPVSLKIAEGTPSGQRLRLRERGLPRGDAQRGDLYAVVRIEVPRRPNPEERAAYEKLKDAATAPADRPAEDS